jgi:ACS family hexuronate transporter-like MFS transporter
MERVVNTPLARPTSWKWWICGLLLLASAINYMDRQTLANAAVRITTQFQLSQEQYGKLEWYFGWAFAAGSVLFGVMVDRLSVRWVYPAVLILWSAIGFATGLVQSYGGLLVCRTLLGLFEAGHWPCAIKTTQRLLEPKDRAMGNSLLQSGASVGAILTPLVMRAMLTEQLASWRLPFQVIGAIGVVWILFWFAMVRETDVAPVREPAVQPRSGPANLATGWRVLVSRRMLVVLFMVACINTCWQTLRAWLPKFLMEGRGYAEADALYFNSLFYVATDVGCLGAGALTLWLARRGTSVHRSRLMVFLGFAALTALITFVAGLPKGWLLLAVLLVVGAGALGVFPVYHALTQEMSAFHQGKVTGLAGVAAWAFSSPGQTLFGRLIDRTGSFDLGFAIVGCLPLAAFLALWLFWDAPGGRLQIESAAASTRT